MLQKEKHLEHLQSLRNANETDSNEVSDYRKSKVRYKKLVKTTKGSFLRKALSSKKPKKVWNAVNRTINPPKNRIRQNKSDLNNYFTILTSNLSGKESEPLSESDITASEEGPRFQHIYYHQVYHLRLSPEDHFEP